MSASPASFGHVTKMLDMWNPRPSQLPCACAPISMRQKSCSTVVLVDGMMTPN